MLPTILCVAVGDSEHDRQSDSALSSDVSPSTSMTSIHDAMIGSRDEADLNYSMLDRLLSSNMGQSVGGNNTVYTSTPRLCGGSSRYVPLGPIDSAMFTLPPYAFQRFFDSLAVSSEKNIQMSFNTAYSDYIGSLDRHILDSTVLENRNNNDVTDYSRNGVNYLSSVGGCVDEKLFDGAVGSAGEENGGVRVKLECFSRDDEIAYGQSYPDRCDVQSYAVRADAQSYGTLRGDAQSDDDSWAQNVVSAAQLLSQDQDGQYGDSGRNWSAACSSIYHADKMGVGCTMQTSSVASRRGKRTICLWQFLKELLLLPQSYQTWIRWLDANRGIFKIEDSMRVARLWGERKNRPAMNYDKLSRSIRQYYRKGIIQKTSNSKRLVYQFCPKYM